MTRRSFAFGAGGAAAVLALGGCFKALPTTPVVRPPGGQDEDGVLSSCIRCEKCYEVCPRGVIRPAHLEDGILGARTPQMTFESDYCDFCSEENGGSPLCAQTCPTGALSLPKGAEAVQTVIGKAELNRDWCLAWHLIGCRFCYDACPYDAIELDENSCPVVIVEKCNGCGACESACVSLKEGSITPGATARAITVVAQR